MRQVWRVVHAGDFGDAPARFRGAHSSSDDTRDTIEDGAEPSASAATTAAATASPGEASPSTAASLPQRRSHRREAPVLAPLPLSPISVSPTQLIGSPAALPPAPIAGGTASGRSSGSQGQRRLAHASPPEARPGLQRALSLVPSPTQPHRASPVATAGPAVLRSIPGAQQDESTPSPERTGGAAAAAPTAQRRLRLELPSHAPANLIVPSDNDEPQLRSPHPTQAAVAHAAAALPCTAANTLSIPLRHPPLGRAPRFHPPSAATAGGPAPAPSPLAVNAAAVAVARESHAAAPAPAGQAAPDSPLSIHGIGGADEDLPQYPLAPASIQLQPHQNAARATAAPAAMAAPHPRPCPEAAASEACPSAVREAVRVHTVGPFAVPPSPSAPLHPSTGAHASAEQQQRAGQAGAQPVHSMFRLWRAGAPGQPAAPAADAAVVRMKPPIRPAVGWRGGRGARGRRVRLQLPEQKASHRAVAAAAEPAVAEQPQRPRRPLPLPDFLLVAPGKLLSPPSRPPRLGQFC